MKFRLTPDAEEQIVSIIQTTMTQHVGADRAIGRAALLAEIHRYEPLISDRMMRRIIEEHLPHLCFSPKGGYFTSASKEEAEKVAKSLEHYIRGLAMRRRAVLSKWPDEEGQLHLGL